MAAGGTCSAGVGGRVRVFAASAAESGRDGGPRRRTVRGTAQGPGGRDAA